MARVIFHIDVNSAFLSWEATRRVQHGERDLRLIPSAIGGDRASRKGVILAKSIPAKEKGVRTGEPIGMALRKCPELVLAPSDFHLYRHCSESFMAICAKYSPLLEQYSIDECFLDMSDLPKGAPDPVQLATALKDEIRDTLGFTVNVGVGSNKLLAKMASDFQKPDRVHTLYTEEIPDKLWPLSVGELFTVGRATAKRLQNAGICTVGQLAASDPSYLQMLLGQKQGAHLYRYANGHDDSPVLGESEDAKGYSNSTTLAEDVTSFEEAHRVLAALADSVTSRMRRDGFFAGCVSVSVRDNHFTTSSHQKRLSEPTDITSEVFEVSCKLFSELWDRRTPLRLLGISLTSLSREAGAQISMFPDPKREKEQQLDRMMDGIRTRFGHNTILRGSAMQYASSVGEKHKDPELEEEAGK